MSILSRLGRLAASAVVGLAFVDQAVGEGANKTVPAQSTFVSPRQDLAFGINVPSDSIGDIFFTLAAPVGVTWAAIGLGSDRMSGSLILMVYESSDGKNVTLSPRLASGHNEPTPYPDLQVDALDGTGVFNDTYVFSGRCRNCRSWTGGSVDVNSTGESFIFAIGPLGTLNSDDPSAPVKYHESFGAFTADLVQATGPGDAPILNAATTNTSSPDVILSRADQDRRDLAALAHAVIMVLVFVGLLPFGLVILRVGGWVRWHAINQALALAFTIAGAGLGIDIGLRYNRSKSFGTAHQIIGLIVCLVLVAQFGLGLLHHRAYKQKKPTLMYKPWHVWMGRLVIPLGVVNGFLGFPLALSPGYDIVLAGLVIAITPVLVCLFVGRKLWDRHLGKRRNDARRENRSPAPQASPDVTQEINLASFAPTGEPRRIPNASLGPQQTPAEYV